MGVVTSYDLTVVELKEKLKELGLSSVGNKADLIQSLNESDPSGTWRGMLSTKEVRTTPVTEEDDEEGAATQRTHDMEQYLSDRRTMQAELDTLRRELEILRATSMQNVSAATIRDPEESIITRPKINVTAIAELLATLDGQVGDCANWIKQLQLLRRTYHLDDEHSRILTP